MSQTIIQYNKRENKSMAQEHRYRLTTIERLAPSLQQCEFQLTNTVLGQPKIESLAFSVSIQKLSFEELKDNGAVQSNQQQKPESQPEAIFIENKQKGTEGAEVIDESGQMKKTKEKKNAREISGKNISQAIAYFEEKNGLALANTASTLKNSEICANAETTELLSHRTHKTKVIKLGNGKIEVSKKQEAQLAKYAPYLEKILVRKQESKPKTARNGVDARKKAASLRK